MTDESLLEACLSSLSDSSYYPKSRTLRNHPESDQTKNKTWFN